jgi:hypothetical protein
MFIFTLSTAVLNMVNFIPSTSMSNLGRRKMILYAVNGQADYCKKLYYLSIC